MELVCTSHLLRLLPLLAASNGTNFIVGCASLSFGHGRTRMWKHLLLEPSTVNKVSIAKSECDKRIQFGRVFFLEQLFNTLRIILLDRGGGWSSAECVNKCLVMMICVRGHSVQGGGEVDGGIQKLVFFFFFLFLRWQ